MKKMVLGVLATVALAFLPAAAQSVDDVISKHVDARGGRAAWDAVETLKVSGNFTSFSLVSPFTLHRKRDDRFHMDAIWNDKPVITGYDGELAWWEHGWYQEGALPVTGQDLYVVLGDVHFATPLFDYKERGYSAELLGPNELEGIPAIGIKLTRPDEQEETWYLDPKSFLEIGRTSPGSDFGNPMVQRTFYDEFKKVEGLVIPHVVEAQWYTRDRVMHVDSVEINVKIDDALFRMPSRLGMDKLRSLEGSWDVTIEQQGRGGAWNESKRTSTIGSDLHGGILEERYLNGAGSEVVRTLSYDRNHERYVLTQMDDASTALDIQLGVFDDEGRLTVSNEKSGTASDSGGGTAYSRLSFFEIEQDGFRVEWSNSRDEGESWTVNAKAVYTRRHE